MATYRIKANYEYEGDIEANSPEEAETLFLKELNDYYMGTESYECYELCEECGDDKDECICEGEGE